MVKRIFKVLGILLFFAVFTFALARWQYPDYIENWEAPTEAGDFESLWFVSAMGVANGIFIINCLVWVWKTIMGKK